VRAAMQALSAAVASGDPRTMELSDALSDAVLDLL